MRLKESRGERGEASMGVVLTDGVRASLQGGRVRVLDRRWGRRGVAPRRERWGPPHGHGAAPSTTLDTVDSSCDPHPSADTHYVRYTLTHAHSCFIAGVCVRPWCLPPLPLSPYDATANQWFSKC